MTTEWAGSAVHHRNVGASDGHYPQQVAQTWNDAVRSFLIALRGLQEGSAGDPFLSRPN